MPGEAVEVVQTWPSSAIPQIDFIRRISSEESGARGSRLSGGASGIPESRISGGALAEWWRGSWGAAEGRASRAAGEERGGLESRASGGERGGLESRFPSLTFLRLMSWARNRGDFWTPLCLAASRELHLLGRGMPGVWRPKRGARDWAESLPSKGPGETVET